MKGILISAAVIGACAVAAVTWVKSSSFAPSRKAPLGERRLIDEWLKEQEFHPSRVDPERAPDPRDDGRRELRFEHHYAESLAHASEVSLIEEGDGALFGISARFWSGKEEVRHPGPNGQRAEILAFTLWKDLAGQLPVFHSEMEGGGRHARQRLVASFARNEAKGRWVKTYDSNGDARTIWDEVSFSRD
ncbi:MAG: hypothetical protein U1F36_12940 [Planctomycetota bacterium]